MRTRAPGRLERLFRRFSSSRIRFARLWPGGKRARRTPALAVGLALAGAVPVFDGEQALDLVHRQVAFGPRVPGSEAHAKALEWLAAELREKGAEVSKRPFVLVSPLTGDTAQCHNVVASFRPELEKRIFFGSHWDSRARADMEAEPEDRLKPVPGANDGASTTAILLVLAGILGDEPPPVGVDLLFFDGEDQGLAGEPTTFCTGSQAFAASISLTGFRPEYGVVIDLAGGKTVRYHPEKHSLAGAPRVMERLLSLADEKLPGWVDRSRTVDIYDDHVPLLDAGIPCALLIGYGYPPWHTVSDTPRHVSARKMEGVGAVLLELIYGEGE